MQDRFAERLPNEALSNTPVVQVIGPRRVGKTTLAREMEEAGCVFLTLDDQKDLDAAQSDAGGFVRGLARANIDEIRRAPELLLAIKKTVDEDYCSGRFLLTGSANVMPLPRVAGRLTLNRPVTSALWGYQGRIGRVSWLRGQDSNLRPIG